MKRTVKNYKNFLKENTEVAPDVKPRVAPGTTPQKRPSRPNPFRKDKPGVDPKPKASDKELVEEFISLSKGDKEIQELLKNKYDN